MLSPSTCPTNQKPVVVVGHGDRVGDTTTLTTDMAGLSSYITTAMNPQQPDSAVLKCVPDTKANITVWTSKCGYDSETLSSIEAMTDYVLQSYCLSWTFAYTCLCQNIGFD